MINLAGASHYSYKIIIVNCNAVASDYNVMVTRS